MRHSAHDEHHQNLLVVDGMDVVVAVDDVDVVASGGGGVSASVVVGIGVVNGGVDEIRR